MSQTSLKGRDFMEFWGNLLKILDAKMPVPTAYGWFHLTFFAISVMAGLLLCRFRKNPGERFVKRLLFISSLIVLILEVYKQIKNGTINDAKTICALMRAFSTEKDFMV